MFTMMITDMPLPMPRSVICSPSHITSIVADVIATTVSSLKPKPFHATSCTGLPAASAPRFRPRFASRPAAMASAWPAQSTSVR